MHNLKRYATVNGHAAFADRASPLSQASRHRSPRPIQSVSGPDSRHPSRTEIYVYSLRAGTFDSWPGQVSDNTSHSNDCIRLGGMALVRSFTTCAVEGRETKLCQA